MCYLILLLVLFRNQWAALQVYIGRSTRRCAFRALWARTKTTFQRNKNMRKFPRFIISLPFHSDCHLICSDVFNYFRGSCKSCPKKLTTCAMAARQCTDCKPPEECSASSQRNYSGAGGDVISPSPTLSKLPTNQRRRQQLHQRQMRLRQQRHRQNNSSTATTTNFRRV